MSNPVCIAIDFETSAPNSFSACSIGLTRLEGENISGEYYSLIRPPSSRVYYTHVHGLTWKMLCSARPFQEIWPEVEEFTQGADYFVAHNASFDRRVLRGCCEKFQINAPDIPFLCTLKGSRKALSIPSNTLDRVCEHLCIPLDHHNAASDARGCALIYLQLLKMGMKTEAMLLGEKIR